MNEEKILKVLEEIRDIQKANVEKVDRAFQTQTEVKKMARRFLMAAFVLIAVFLLLSFFSK